MKKLIILSLLFVATIFTVHAQPEDNGGDPLNNDVPVDGGLSILAAAGIAYGVKKRRQALKHGN